MLEPVIQFNQVIKDYGRKKIGPLDLVVNRGSIVGFLGPNGSGKTTAIRQMLGLIRPTSGYVKINGLDPITKHTSALKNVGYSPELPNIQSFLTPRELLSLIAHILRLQNRHVEEEIRRVLELVGLIEYTNVKVGKMSKGMVQRLSIAQALIGSPEVLILDEPMIGLDPAGTAHLREVFKNFAKHNGGTIFLSSHMMNEVQNLCDSITMIHGGKMVLSGTIEEVTQRMVGFSSITVEAEGISQKCIEEIKMLEGVTDVIFDGRRSMQIEIARGKNKSGDLRPKIAELVMSSHGKLYTIKPSENLLERAYIEALSEVKN